MIIKILGAVFVIASTSAIGLQISKAMKLHIQSLQLLRKIMVMLKGEITYTNTPLEEAFQLIGRKVGGEYGHFLEEVALRLALRSGERFPHIWKEEIDKQLKRVYLNGSDLEELKLLGENLGYLDAQLQSQTIDLYLEQIEITINSLRENLSQRCRLCTSLGVMGGIFITIVML